MRWWRLCGGIFVLVARVALALATIAVLVVALLYLRLLQGPIVLPGLAKLAAERFNAANDQVRIEAADMILKLGEGDAPSGLQFRDVVLRTQDGQPLFAAPRLAASFHLADLVQGRTRARPDRTDRA